MYNFLDGEMTTIMVAMVTTVGQMTMMNRGVKVETEDGVMTAIMIRTCFMTTFHLLGKGADMGNIQDWYVN